VLGRPPNALALRSFALFFLLVGGLRADALKARQTPL
jgi:hypothetical protein